MNRSLLWMSMIPISVLAICSLAFGLGADSEPNNTCLTAQNFGAVILPFALTGSLDTPPTTPDVDFFRFTGTPNTLVRVDLEGVATGQGTLEDPLVGLFDSACHLLAFDDDAGTGGNSSLQFTIPADGVFILAAADFDDINFTGEGSAGVSYRLTITQVAAAKSISGRLLDAVDRTPVPGDIFPFGLVDLYRCRNAECTSTEHVRGQSTDSLGRFRFDRGPGGVPLMPGAYQLRASADQYQEQTILADVAADEDLDVGDILLTPLPVQIVEVQPCEDLPAGGALAHILSKSVTVLGSVSADRRGVSSKVPTPVLPLAMTSFKPERPEPPCHYRKE